jgi:hypothetical protein
MSRSALKFSCKCAIAFIVNLAVACSAFAQRSQTAETRYHPASARHWIVFDFSAGTSAAPLTLKNARICSAQIKDLDQLSQCQEWQPDTYIDSGGLIYIEVFPESGAGTYSLVHNDTTIADEAIYIRGTSAPAAATQAANLTGQQIFTSKQTAQSFSTQLALPETAATSLADAQAVLGDVKTQVQTRSVELAVLQVNLSNLEQQVKVTTNNPDQLKSLVDQATGVNAAINNLNESTAKLVLTESAASAKFGPLCSSSENNPSCGDLETIPVGMQAQDHVSEQLNKQMQDIVHAIKDLGQKAINKTAGPPVVLFLGQFTGNTLVTFSLCEKKAPSKPGGTGSDDSGTEQSGGTTALCLCGSKSTD